MPNNPNNQHHYITLLNDKPLNSTNTTTFEHQDTLGASLYKDALVDVIKKCETPNTIAIQGEWGSGKTSLMEGIKADLCEGKAVDKVEVENEVKTDGKDKECQFYPIWINTWQFDLTDSTSQAVIDILKSIIKQITNHAKNDAPNKYKTKLWNFLLVLYKLRYILLPVLYCTLKLLGISNDTISILKKGEEIVNKIQEAFDKNNNSKINNNADIVKKLKGDINNQVKTIIDRSNKKGLIFFIDDLDRINPSLAVDLLDIFKNLFDFEGCVFILAMDHKVLVRGLQFKLVILHNTNKHEFLQYFDKFVQLPFTLQVQHYNTSEFLKKYLHDISFLETENTSSTIKENKVIEIEDKYKEHLIPQNEFNFIKNIVIRKTIGNNPRSLKRFINIVALTDAIRRRDLESMGIIDLTPGNLPTQNKVLILILTCMQIAFPTVYRLIINHTDFTKWNDDLATSLNLPKVDCDTLIVIKKANRNLLCINEDMYNITNTTDIYIPNIDKVKQWELFLFRFCQQDKTLQQNFVTILFLVSTIIDRYRGKFNVIDADLHFVRRWITITDINFNL